jgi:hypothetical protein
LARDYQNCLLVRWRALFGRNTISAPKSDNPHVFHGRKPPRPAEPAGYSWLIDQYRLDLPIAARLAAIGTTHTSTDSDSWLILTPRHAPEPTLAGNLAFALKWEGVDLAVLRALTKTVSPADLADAVRSAPNGQYMRRAWFLFEWLSGQTLDIPDIGSKRSAVLALDPDQQCALIRGEPSPRHRVVNNLPGTPAFCPLVRRTVPIRDGADSRLDEQVKSVMGRTRRDLIARAGAFLMLSDSRASFAIEKEKPTANRLERWATAVGRAGTDEITVDALTNLQRLLIDDSRFVTLGLRADGGFVGEHDRHTGAPLPEHVDARSVDLPDLLRGLAAFDARVRERGFDPVVAAATLAFGFVYIHPFEDGNGRIHRWLIHHVLSAMQFAPRDVVFPVSAAIHREMDHYRWVLESYSKPLLPHIAWRPTESGNVEVLNDTADFYRFFDATAHAEFLYHCVEETVVHDIPNEVQYLENYDRFVAGVQDVVDMPARTADLLHRFLRQGDGKLSQRARDKEFNQLTGAEVEMIETLFAGEPRVTSLDVGDAESFRAQAILPATEILSKATSHGFWRVIIRPLDFLRRRLENIAALPTLMREAAVSYRGWPYPSVLDRERAEIGDDWIGFEIDSRIHVETWRLFQSGQFMQVMGFWEDWYGQDTLLTGIPPQGKTLGIDLTIGTLTELFEFAANLAASPAGGETMVIEIDAHGLAGRHLTWPRGRDDVLDRRPATLDHIALDSLVVDRRRLVANPDDYAARAAREVFRRFGWDAELSEVNATQRGLRRR